MVGQGSTVPVWVWVLLYDILVVSFLQQYDEEFFVFSEDFDEMFDDDDDEVLECGLENPEYCESCQ